MKKIILIFFTLCTLTILFLPGCVPSKPTEEEIEILPSERLINKLEANRRRIRTFEGEGTINIQSPELNNSATFKVSLVKPDSIALTIMGPFGIELANALVTKDNFIFYDAMENTAYEGSVDSDILKEIFKIDLTFADLLDAFVGSVNLTDHLYKQPSDYEIIYDKYLLTYVDSASMKTSRYNIDVRNLGITNFEVANESGDNILEGKYRQFEYIEGVAVPYKTEVSNVKQKQKINIEYKKIEVNTPGISVDFQIPQDATIIKW